VIVRTLVAGGVTPKRTQPIEHVQTAIALAAANAGFAFVPESADNSWHGEVIFRPLDAVVPNFETVALWLRGNADPLVRRVLGIFGRIHAHPDLLARSES
jgi:DNA-binding transcriptional LysR family regulator